MRPVLRFWLSYGQHDDDDRLSVGPRAGGCWLVGGMVFLSVVLVPVFRLGRSGQIIGFSFKTRARRFRIIVWIMMGILVLSGPLLISSRTGTLEEPEAWRSVLHLKLWLAAGLVLLNEDSLRVYRVTEPKERHVQVYGIDTAIDFDEPLIL